MIPRNREGVTEMSTLALILILSLGGGLVSMFCAFVGGIFILYLAFKEGPKLTLFAIPVAIIFFLVTETDLLRLMNMFDVYMMKPLIILLAIDVVLLFIRGVITGESKLWWLGLHGPLLIMAMLIILGAWTSFSQELPDLEGTEYIEIQEIHSTVQVESTDHAVFDGWLDDFNRAELVGGFQEDLVYNNPNTIYRFTCKDADRNLIAEFHFINNRHVLMEYKGHILVYESVEPGKMPNIDIIEFHDRILGY